MSGPAVEPWTSLLRTRSALRRRRFLFYYSSSILLCQIIPRIMEQGTESCNFSAPNFPFRIILSAVGVNMGCTFRYGNTATRPLGSGPRPHGSPNISLSFDTSLFTGPDQRGRAKISCAKNWRGRTTHHSYCICIGFIL